MSRASVDNQSMWLDILASSQAITLECHTLGIPERKHPRPELADAVLFIVNGLTQNSPIAFLNLCNGEVDNLEEWHWVTVVALETDENQDQVLVTIFDGDKSETIDFKRWLQTTGDGGALIYLGTGV